MIGETVSHYRILAKLGEGGMGVVYRAEDTRLGREVALKFLPPEWSRDTDAMARFVREAKAAAALSHPNICTVFEIDDVDGRMFIAMALIDGESLADRVDRGPLKVKDSVDIAIQVAEGLARRAPGGDRPQGRQARQHHAGLVRTRESHGLRAREVPRPDEADEGGDDDGDDRVHVPGTGPRGGRRQARRILGELRDLDRPYLYGENKYLAGRVAAQLGEPELAVELLREAFASGTAIGLRLHQEMAFEPLHGYKPFEELRRPKGEQPGSPALPGPYQQTERGRLAEQAAPE